jgi:hypothetical protein
MWISSTLFRSLLNFKDRIETLVEFWVACWNPSSRWDHAMRAALWPHLKKAALLRLIVSLKLAVARAVR